MTYKIDFRSGVPSYRQLADLLRAGIEEGRIEPDGPLPSLVRLQQETGLAVGTIRRAIALLVAEEVVYIVPGRGTYARPPE